MGIWSHYISPKFWKWDFCRKVILISKLLFWMENLLRKSVMLQCSNFQSLNRRVMKIYCPWIGVRLTVPEALLYDVNTKKTLSKICQKSFWLRFWVVSEIMFQTNKYFENISKVPLFWDFSWEQNILYS
jgi:hypothetical protein